MSRGLRLGSLRAPPLLLDAKFPLSGTRQLDLPLPFAR